MSTYLLINILVVILPLILSFEPKIKFYRKVPAFLTAFLLVGIPYIIWDGIATLRGDWDFSPLHTHNLELYGLPLEEILFFLCVPYSSIFLYETISVYLKDKTVSYNKTVYYLLSVFFILSGLFFSGRYYTSTVLIFTGISFFLINRFMPSLFASRNYWIFTASSYIGFFIVNFILTSLPVVTYSPEAILGWRLLTIPAEDLFYSYSMLSLYLFIYLKFRSNLNRS